MRHKVKKVKLGSDKDHRRALIRNLAMSLIIHEQIKTTAAKAKAVQPFVERLITLAKNKDTVSGIREVDKLLQHESASKKLFEVLLKRYDKQNSGFTRIVKLGYRNGDKAPVVQIAYKQRTIMKTTTLKKDEIKKNWLLIDAEGVTLGKLATKVADILRGKDKPYFSPHMDCGDFVIIVNAEKVKLTGNKWRDKLYHKHSGFPGGYKNLSAEELVQRHPTKIVELAISGMLPKNRLRQVFMSKLNVYAGPAHPHEAQKPTTLEV